MPLSVDARRIVKAWVIPWERDGKLYRIAYETSDGMSGNDLVGTKAEAGALLASIEAQRSVANDVITPFPKGIAAS
jgi:hypothetical protein